MFIFSKQNNTILNTEQIVEIYVDEESTLYYHTVKNNDYSADLFLAEYETPERAQEILQQIFKAMKYEEKTFELPED